MFKKVIATGLMLTVMLSASACGKESSGASGTAVDTPVESSTVESQPTEEETKDLAVDEGTESSAEESQPIEEEADYSYIFSDMPIAAYEVTGLGVGLNAEVYTESIYDAENDYDLGVVPLVKLDSSNTFVIFCLLGNHDGGYISTATIHSPSGSSPWEANEYTCSDGMIPEVEGYTCGSPCLMKYGYNNDEEDFEGSFESLIDPWTEYIRFAEIYHPDAPQEDTIYVIEALAWIGDEDYDEPSEITTAMVSIFEHIGATSVQEIPVEEALERFNIIVSEEGAD